VDLAMSLNGFDADQTADVVDSECLVHRSSIESGGRALTKLDLCDFALVLLEFVEALS
jgi:hypothetical protein